MTDLRKKIHDAARKSGLSMLQMSKRAGIPYAAVHAFMRGGGLTLTTASKLCDLFGLELRPVRKATRKGR